MRKITSMLFLIIVTVFALFIANIAYGTDNINTNTDTGAANSSRLCRRRF